MEGRRGVRKIEVKRKMKAFGGSVDGSAIVGGSGS
jgi:hypothetical protein